LQNNDLPQDKEELHTIVGEEQENIGSDQELLTNKEKKTSNVRNKRMTVVIKRQQKVNQTKNNKTKVSETKQTMTTRSRTKRELPSHLELKVIRPDFNPEAPPKRGRPKKYELRPQTVSAKVKNPPRRYPCPFNGCEYVAKYRVILFLFQFQNHFILNPIISY
jgi:hypothetical protein